MGYTSYWLRKIKPREGTETFQVTFMRWNHSVKEDKAPRGDGNYQTTQDMNNLNQVKEDKAPRGDGNLIFEEHS